MLNRCIEKFLEWSIVIGLGAFFPQFKKFKGRNVIKEKMYLFIYLFPIKKTRGTPDCKQVPRETDIANSRRLFDCHVKLSPPQRFSTLNGEHTERDTLLISLSTHSLCSTGSFSRVKPLYWWLNGVRPLCTSSTWRSTVDIDFPSCRSCLFCHCTVETLPDCNSNDILPRQWQYENQNWMN